MAKAQEAIKGGEQAEVHLGKLIDNKFSDAERCGRLSLHDNPNEEGYKLEGIGLEVPDFGITRGPTSAYIYRHQVVSEAPVIFSRAFPRMINLKLSNDSLPDPFSRSSFRPTSIAEAWFAHRDLGGQYGDSLYSTVMLTTPVTADIVSRRPSEMPLAEVPVAAAFEEWLYVLVHIGKIIESDKVIAPKLAFSPKSYMK